MVFGFSGFRGSCFRLRKFEKLDWLVVMGLRTSVVMGLRTLTTARLAEYDGTGRKSTPFFFYFHHIIRTTSALLASCYHSCCQHQPHRHPHRHRTHRVALYCTTSHCPAGGYTNNSRSSLIFLPHHICYRPCRRQPYHHSHRHRTHRIAPYCTTTHCPSECCANHS